MRGAELVTGSAAGVGATVLILDKVSLVVLGVPVAAFFAAVFGAIFGAAFIPTDSKLSKPLTVLAQMGAGIFIGGGGSSLAGWTNAPVICGVVFLLSSSPGIVIALGPLALAWVRKRLGVENV